MKLLKIPVFALATVVLTVGIAKADIYTFNANIEDFGDPEENVFTHVFVLGNVESIDTVDIELSHSWAADIEFTMTAPNGDTFDFSTDNGGSADLGDGSSVLSGVATYEFLESGAADGDSTGWGGEGPGVGGQYNAETWFSGGWATGDWTLILNDDSGADDGAVGQVNVVYTATIPEPASATALLALGGLMFLRRR